LVEFEQALLLASFLAKLALLLASLALVLLAVLA
jgi:hypothetical protein